MSLTEEKIDDLAREMVKGDKSVNWLARAIEAAVREELAKQVPVARATGYYGGRSVVEVLNPAAIIPVGMALYAAPMPVVQQEPVAWCFVQNGFTHYTDDKRDWYDAVGVEEVTPLYAAPVVQPDMVMVPMEPTEAMIDAAMNRYKHVSPEAKARYTKMHRENFRCDYRAMIAAAEGKSNAVAHREAARGRSGGAEG